MTILFIYYEQLKYYLNIQTYAESLKLLLS